METKIYSLDDIDEAAAALKAGQLVAFPTETVYGLGADATNVEAVSHVYAAKGRPSDNPLIVTIADVATLTRFAQPLSDKVKTLIDTFWPGSLTIILPLKPNALSKTVTGGLDTAAFRMPANNATLKLIRTAGVPIVGPSANTSGKPSPTLAEHVYHDLKGKIAGILDDGPTDVGVESTIIDMSTEIPTILRPGAVTEDQLADVIGEVRGNKHKVGANETPKAPGMKYKHYAPTAQVTIVDDPTDFAAAVAWVSSHNSKAGLMATDSVLSQLTVPDSVEVFTLGPDVAAASHRLFAGLRHFDLETDVTAILTQGFSTDGLGAAYMNRLNKSAGDEHFTNDKSIDK
ncbi:L-threonylcarbamoyladenylate synthase [Secundilactobacillus paracollinoides]|uniref:Threonylcarbamoyl-AMP synthase n=1 Tax=Secundilactobacillus paracollinoides TaxID=240427 RepID=A0A1B2IZU8_9LACO|nr:L-threonylcarbamoyladenylate synthase [Secundilactobacillus paracollinoides]ANZ61673.1 translation factor Sua5 [Secundilactobacillus paracollinoides]ANZ67591.1 translation factor Sua5 [Secundilactobacillus paracollinoides]KRL76014.1 SUA5 family translation factor [Secundilactobacillus paracollinoides DSM 15502 = JCM 11969]